MDGPGISRQWWTLHPGPEIHALDHFSLFLISMVYTWDFLQADEITRPEWKCAKGNTQFICGVVLLQPKMTWVGHSHVNSWPINLYPSQYNGTRYLFTFMKQLDFTVLKVPGILPICLMITQQWAASSIKHFPILITCCQFIQQQY